MDLNLYYKVQVANDLDVDSFAKSFLRLFLLACRANKLLFQSFTFQLDGKTLRSFLSSTV